MTKKRTKTTSTKSLTNGLTSTDIVKIINACSKAGVKRLEFKELKLSLDSATYAVSSWDTPEPSKLSGFTIDNSLEIGDTDDTEVRDKVTEEEIEELKISNPLAYEEIMNNA